MIINHVQLVLEDELVNGSIEIADGVIRQFDSQPSRSPAAIDGQQAYLLPGLIELHTDNLEKYFSPRPKVTWPQFSAMAAHDAQIIASGITTILDAVCIGDERGGGARSDQLEQILATLVESEARGVNRAQHLLHLRCELPNEKTVALFEQHADNPLLQLVSLMDHAPGQRQFVDRTSARHYYMGKYGYTLEEMVAFEDHYVTLAERWSAPNRQEIAARCRQRGVPMASHDDATTAHVQESKQLGMVIAEFPTTLEAARLSHEQGLKVLMGAPNVIRGGSHSGNIAAHELAALGYLDVLSSDYVPNSLLDACFRLAADERNPLDLPAALRLVTAHPAAALGLADRGTLAVGKRADLVLARPRFDHLYIERVWRAGQIVF